MADLSRLNRKPLPVAPLPIAVLPPAKIPLEGHPPPEAKRAKPVLRTVSAADLLAMDIKPREMALAPIMPLPGLSMLYAPRGMGKTFVAMSIACGIAAGGTALRWTATAPRRVLYIDGEMPAGQLQERLALILRGSDRQPEPGHLQFLASDLMPDGMPSITRSEVQEAIDEAATQSDVVILDNLSTLAGGLRENEADDWEGLQRWLLSLRRNGKSVLMIHHAGKGGQQRGTSRREDVLDTVIALRRPADYDPERGAQFEVHTEKARGIMGSEAAPFLASLASAPGAGVTWACADLHDAQRDVAERLLRDGMSVRDIADETGIPKSTVHRLKRKMEAPDARA
jgi:putative DNA primase/helicase